MYKTSDGRRRRFRRDAQVQTATAARAEERRLLAELASNGEIATTAPAPTLEPVATLAAAPTPESTKPPEHTFDDAVDYYKRTRAVSALKPSTRYSYTDLLDRVLIPRFGKRRLAEIDVARLAEMDAALVKDKLSASSRRNVHIVLRSVLRAAHEAAMVAELPPFPKLPKVGRTVLKALTRTMVDAILAVASPSARLAFSLAAFAGLRAGEVRGLLWEDVDLGTRILVVRQAISRGIATAPKSGHDRVVPLAKPLRDLLKEAAKMPHTPSSPAAPTKHGTVWGEWGLLLAFRRAQERAKLSGSRFHDLRHFFVTELFRGGSPAPAVQALAGHADLTTTQRYAHMVTSDLRAAIARLDRGNGVEMSPTT